MPAIETDIVLLTVAIATFATVATCFDHCGHLFLPPYFLHPDHVRDKLPQDSKMASNAKPCPIDSSVHVELRNAPAVYTLAVGRCFEL